MATLVGAELRLASLLSEISASKGSGIITAIRARHRRLFCLDDGWVIFAASNIVEEQFTEKIVERRILTRDALAAARVQAESRQKEVTVYLMEQGRPSSDVLVSAMRDYIGELLGSSLEWPDGRYVFAKGTPKLTGEPIAQVSCVSVLLEHARHHPGSIDDVRVRIGPPDIHPKIDPEAAERVEPDEIDDTARYLLDHCDGSRNLGQLIQDAPGDEASLLRAVHGLLLARVLLPTEKPGPAAKKKVGGSPEELLGRLTMSEGANHYMILGLESNVSHQAIRDAYYYLALRFHPDRFRVTELQDFVSRAEEYFTKVTDAYNTLFDENLRAEYDRQQTERSSTKTAPEQDASYLARENYARAKVLINKKHLQEAVRFLENAVSLDASNPLYHIELGHVLIGNPRRRDESEKHLLTAVELDPTSVAGLLALGQLYTKIERLDDAKQRYHEALHWDPANSEAKAALKQLEGKASKRRRGFFRS